MEQLRLSTSITGMTNFSIAISEEFGWIGPVFLLISPNLGEILRLDKIPNYLDKIEHFEIINFKNTYALNFFNSDNNLVIGNSPELIIRRAPHVCRQKHDNGKVYSIFEYSYLFVECSQHLEYCFFYKANSISYLTSFTAFAVEDY